MRFSSSAQISSQQKFFASHGFGLVELMVCISIIAIISGVIITKNTAFNGAVLLRNQTYEVAFALRQAQLLAVSGARFSGDPLYQRYGVYFDTGTTGGANQTYQTFHDLNDNGVFDSGATPAEEYGAAGRLDKRFKIRTLTRNGGTDTAMSVTFTRPNFDADFVNGGGTAQSGPLYIDISQIGAGGSDTDVGKVRRIEVTNPGQISVTIYP